MMLSRLLGAFLLVSTLSARSAAAQTPLQPPPIIPYGLPISIADAKTVAAAAVAEARAHNWAMAIAIVDPAGFLVYFEKMQDTQNASVELSLEKARTSALFRRPTKVFQDALAAGGDNLRVLGLTGVIPNAGGIPLVVGGKLIGAIGVSGGSVDQDAQVAQSGVAALK
jgi:uncharacterized protein GlcG (DUF336 family)